MNVPSRLASCRIFIDRLLGQSSGYEKLMKRFRGLLTFASIKLADEFGDDLTRHQIDTRSAWSGKKSFRRKSIWNKWKNCI